MVDDVLMSRDQLIAELAAVTAERDQALARVGFLRAALDSVPVCPHSTGQDLAGLREEMVRVRLRLREACAYVPYPDILRFRDGGCTPARSAPDA